MDNLSLIKFVRKTYSTNLAYNNFLKSKRIDPNSNKKITFKEIPLTNKKNYLEKYPIENRLEDNRHISDFYMICTSSGSTGEPTIWPRDYEKDTRAIEFNYAMYKDLFNIESKKTLVVVTFGLGAWTAGMLTSRLCWELSKFSKVSVVTPGLDKEIALKSIKKLGGYYDQTIITGYPPFIIDLIEHGISVGFDFKKINTKIHYTSARLLEDQRNELTKLVSKNNSRSDVLGFYASSEAGIIGIETPETVGILEVAYKDQVFSKALFGNVVPPSFVIYNPKIKYLEAVDGRIIITAEQSVPLVRYDTKDRGGVFDGHRLKEVCNAFGKPISENLENKHFAYIFGRDDAVRLLSNIYIDDVAYCIEKSRFNSKFTGNFKYGLVNSGLRNLLKVVVFMRPNKKLNSKEYGIFAKEFKSNLIEINPDFKMVGTGINFDFIFEFKNEVKQDYKGGKFNYFL